jgi:hypothetical protein
MVFTSLPLTIVHFVLLIVIILYDLLILIVLSSIMLICFPGTCYFLSEFCALQQPPRKVTLLVEATATGLSVTPKVAAISTQSSAKTSALAPKSMTAQTPKIVTIPAPKAPPEASPTPAPKAKASPTPAPKANVVSPIVHVTVHSHDSMRKIGLCAGVNASEVIKMLKTLFPETKPYTLIGFRHNQDSMSLEAFCKDPHVFGANPAVLLLTSRGPDLSSQPGSRPSSAALNSSGSHVASSSVSNRSFESFDRSFESVLDESQPLSNAGSLDELSSQSGSQGAVDGLLGTVISEKEAAVLELLVKQEDPGVRAALEAFPSLQLLVGAFLRMARYTFALHSRASDSDVVGATLADASEEDQQEFKETLNFMVSHELLTERQQLALQHLSANEHPALVAILKRYLANHDKTQLMKALLSIAQHALEVGCGCIPYIYTCNMHMHTDIWTCELILSFISYLPLGAGRGRRVSLLRPRLSRLHPRLSLLQSQRFAGSRLRHSLWRRVGIGRRTRPE